MNKKKDFKTYLPRSIMLRTSTSSTEQQLDFLGLIFIILAHGTFASQYNIRWMERNRVLSYRKWQWMSMVLLIASVSVFVARPEHVDGDVTAFMVIVSLLYVLYLAIAISFTQNSRWTPLLVVVLLSVWITSGGLIGGGSTIAGSVLFASGTPLFLGAIHSQRLDMGLFSTILMTGGAHLLVT